MATRDRLSTEMLIAHARGDPKAHQDLSARVYADLHKLAVLQFRNERTGHSLQPTALVHEAYLRLIDDRKVNWQARTQFLAMAAKQMRRVLVDHYRRKVAIKRFGGARRVTLAEDVAVTPDGTLDFIALHEALERLASLSVRQAQVVECRFFGGMSIRETARALGVAERTVKQDWTVARTWLARELRPHQIRGA